MSLVILGFGSAVILFLIAALLLLMRWIQVLWARVHKLEIDAEAAAGKRHTENTTAGIEDALAVLMRIAVEEQMQADYRRVWIEKAQTILQATREGPRAYPVDSPAGNRVRYNNRRLKI
jgi:hypothetical protein